MIGQSSSGIPPSSPTISSMVCCCKTGSSTRARATSSALSAGLSKVMPRTFLMASSRWPSRSRAKTDWAKSLRSCLSKLSLNLTAVNVNSYVYSSKSERMRAACPFCHSVKFSNVCFFPESGCFLLIQARIFLGRTSSTPKGPDAR